MFRQQNGIVIWVIVSFVLPWIQQHSDPIHKASENDYCSYSWNLFFFVYLPSPNLGLTPPGTYNPNARGWDACRGSNSLWTRTLDRYARVGLPECVVSTISGPPPETTQYRTQTKDTHPILGQKLKFLTPPGIELGPSGWKAGTLPTMPRRWISWNIQ